MASISPVALSLTGATALCDLVARIRRNAPPPGKSLRHQAFKHLTAWQIPGARRRWCCRYLLRCGPRT
ncbi:TPA: hypothetical protein MFX86_19870 [Klebsiella pneumoniae]|nr:hypothetical protein BME20_25275 [Klebsiella pneumoniae]OXU47645.1 hypothetical protein BME35_24255 [Klebsiella pneumoniae]HBW9979734.1 hypothetical protein [Klebsiella pneumoniae]